MLNIELHKIDGKVIHMSFGETDVMYDVVLTAEVITWKGRAFTIFRYGTFCNQEFGHIGTPYFEVSHMAELGDREEG